MAASSSAYTMNPSITVTGAAIERQARQRIDMVSITIDKDAYFVDIVLPDALCNLSQLGFNVTPEGHVYVCGMVNSGALVRDVPMVYRPNMRRHQPPGPWSISFWLPGPVDLRFPSPKLNANGIMELVVLKKRRSAFQMVIP